SGRCRPWFQGKEKGRKTTTARSAAATVTSNPTSRPPRRRRDLIAVAQRAGCSTSQEECPAAGRPPAPTDTGRGSGSAWAALVRAVLARRAGLEPRVRKSSDRERS